MALATAKTSGRRTSSLGLESQKPSGSPATTDSSQTEDTRPTKKPRTLRLNGPKKIVVGPDGPSQQQSSAATRPPRARRPPATFGHEEHMGVEPLSSTKSARRAPSPAPSAGSSSLSSAPPSSGNDSDGSRSESPFQDPVETSTTEAYGDDFTLWYTTGLDASTQPEKPDKKDKKRKRDSSSSKPTSKADATNKAERAKKPTKATAAAASRRSSSSTKATATQSAPAEQPAVPAAQNLPPQSIRGPASHHEQQYPHMTGPLPAQGPPPVHQHHHGPAPYPQSHPPPPGPHVQQASRPPPPPAPVIRFIEVPHDPVPVVPDTIAIMINKLQSLSATLTQFGGVPTVAVTPPPEPKPAPNPLDMILDAFDGDDDDDDDDESDEADAPSASANETAVPEVKDFNQVLPNPGTPDAPLCFGIQFIQNALKSWAQQRMTHQIMAQWNDEQSLGSFVPQNGRGRGRPKKFEDPPGGPPPIIEMNLTDTPEGIAIQKFQSILDSGCLQVNTVLPIELARALRLLYMQIDNLINQGRTQDKGNWYCMSYAAQITAHHTRLNQFKEADARRQQELALSQQQHHQQVMAQMGLNPHTTPMTQDEAQRHHAMELERRRSAQHAQQQPYLSQHHLHPMQLASQASESPQQHGSCPAVNAMQVTPDMPDGSVPVNANGILQKNHFDRVKMYMPGILPLSRQSMKFSFAPHSEEAIRAFGPEAFPLTGPVGPQLPNRGPMMDVPRMHSTTAAHHSHVGDTPMPDAVRSPSVSNTKEDAIDLTASDGPQLEESGVAAPRPASSNGNIGGFRPINAPTRSTPKSAPVRRSSVPAQQALDSVENDIRRPSTTGIPVVRRQNRGSAGSFPHPGAVVVDQ